MGLRKIGCGLQVMTIIGENSKCIYRIARATSDNVEARCVTRPCTPTRMPFCEDEASQRGGHPLGKAAAIRCRSSKSRQRRLSSMQSQSMNPDRVTIRVTTPKTLSWPLFEASAKGSHWVQTWQTIGDERLLGNGHGLAAIMLGSGAAAPFQKRRAQTTFGEPSRTRSYTTRGAWWGGREIPRTVRSRVESWLLLSTDALLHPFKNATLERRNKTTFGELSRTRSSTTRGHGGEGGRALEQCVLELSPGSCCPLIR